MSEQNRPLRIAIIEDNSIDRSELKSALLRGSTRRYEFVEAEFGDEGLSLCRTHPLPDCIVLDYHLPDMDAQEFLAELPRENALLTIPVLVLTGKSDSDASRAIVRAGAQDFIGKDWLTPVSMTRAIENALERHRAERDRARRAQRESLLLEVTRTILSDHPDTSHLIAAIYELIAPHLKTEWACFVEPDSQGQFQVVWQTGEGTEAASFLHRTLEPENVTENSRKSPDSVNNTNSLEPQEGNAAYLRQPLVTSEGKALAVFALAGTAREPFDEEETGFVQTICLSLTVALERRQAENALQDSEQRLRFAGEAAEIGFWSWNLEQNTVVLDPTCAQLLGLQLGASTPIDQAFAAIHPDDRVRIQAATEFAIKEAGRYESEFRVIRANGEVRWLAGLGRLVHAGNGPLRLAGVNWDISDRKQAEEERAQLLESERFARATAERESRFKDEFLATLGHELRTPLNAILGWAHLIDDPQIEPEERQRGLKVIERNAQAQAQLIEDLLDVSRIISGKIRLDVQPLNLAGVVDAAIATVQPAADAKGVRLQQVIDPLASAVSGDPNRLQQVIWNLLSNAIKFTPKGGKVQVLLERVNSHLELTIADSGIGIAPEFLPHVFDRFRQADGSSTRQYSGLGLGLSIVRHLIELHGGTVRAKSLGKGQGSTFIIALPLAPVRSKEEDSESRQHPSAGPVNFALEEEPSLKGVMVLVVDDVEDARELMQRVLQARGARVFLASSADEAFETLQQKAPHVLVSDIGMPGEDGYELIRRVRALPQDSGGRTPAVALTAFARAEDRRRAIAAGYQMHLSKPVDAAELTTVISSLASLSSSERAS